MSRPEAATASASATIGGTITALGWQLNAQSS